MCVLVCDLKWLLFIYLKQTQHVYITYVNIREVFRNDYISTFPISVCLLCGNKDLIDGNL